MLTPLRPLVSVVIPTQNRARMLDNAIASVLAQTVTDLEVIVVDDHSTDNSHAVVVAYDDPRVQYIRLSAAGGASAARNAGIHASKGTFIAFLDDDDEWMPEKLERQFAALDGGDAILCNVRLMSNGAVLRRYRKVVIEPKDLRRGFTFGGGTSTFLIRARLIKDVLFDESLPCYQDWDVLLRLCSRYKTCFLDEPLVLFNDGTHQRISHGAISGSSADEDRLRPIFKHRDFLGPFWVRYHVAKQTLSHFKERRHKMAHLIAVIRRCGVVPVLLLCYHRLDFKMQSKGLRFANPRRGISAPPWHQQ
jgi:glycosyltransferase involved in cell wall biosynthesis